jgi:tetratricopeptide (TPR) repeat protein
VCPSQDDPARPPGGVTISGTIGSVGGDIVGRDKIIIGEDAETAERRHLETRQDLQALPDAVTAQMMAALRQSGVIPGAETEGLAERTVLALARRLRPEEAHDLDRAVREVEHAVEIALATIRRGERPSSNEHAFVDQVLAEVARRTREGALDQAAQAVDDGLAGLDVREADQRAALRRARVTLLEAGIDQDLLRRDAAAVARRVEALVGLEMEAPRVAVEIETRQRRPAWAPSFHARWDGFYGEGRDKGLNLSLEVAIALARRMLETAATPDERGAAGNLLGNALSTLGERESGTARLEEAVTAYRDALKEYTSERVPLDWAMTQNNLGNALWTLGARESGTARLEQAVTAYRDALKERTRERVPLDWATTQNNLGTALSTLGERESGTARLEEAVTAYRDALKEYTSERVPLDWAMTQNNLGNALWTLGARESGTARLEEAVTAYRDALKERTRERVPLDWAATQTNLGTALSTLGERESGTARLEEAVTAYRDALKEYTRERVPLQWATTQNNLGNALWTLGARESGTARLEEAVTAFCDALKERTRERVPLQWATTQNNLGNALWTLGARESGTARLEEAVTAFRDALKERTRERVPLDWAMTQNNLGTALAALGGRGDGTAQLEAALAAFEACLTVVVSAWPEAWVDDVRRRRDEAQAEAARR